MPQGALLHCVYAQGSAQFSPLCSYNACAPEVGFRLTADIAQVDTSLGPERKPEELSRALVAIREES